MIELFLFLTEMLINTLSEPISVCHMAKYFLSSGGTYEASWKYLKEVFPLTIFPLGWGEKSSARVFIELLLFTDHVVFHLINVL